MEQTEFSVQLQSRQKPRFRTLGGSISDSVSSMIIRGSLSHLPEEREAAARSLLSLGDSVSARIAFRNGLRKACEESLDVRPLASALASLAHCPSSLFGACVDSVRSGDWRLSAAGAELGSALARRLDDDSALAAVDECLRMLGSHDMPARRGAGKLLLALAKHPATDNHAMAGRARDSGTKEAEDFALKASSLPPKVIDVEAA